MASGIFVFPPSLTASSKGQALSDTLFASLSLTFSQGMSFYENLAACPSTGRFSYRAFVQEPKLLEDDN